MARYGKASVWISARLTATSHKANGRERRSWLARPSRRYSSGHFYNVPLPTLPEGEQPSPATGRLTRDPGADLERWLLPDYVEVAGELGIIKQGTVQQARLAQGFRNLIHPGRVIRLGVKCDRGTALSALAAVELVVRDLTPP